MKGACFGRFYLLPLVALDIVTIIETLFLSASDARAGMVELADTSDLGSDGRTPVEVRVLLPAFLSSVSVK